MKNDHLRPTFFCIVGRARSGTTLLRMLLDGHPQLIIPPECAFVQHLYSRFGKTRTWNEATVNTFIRCLNVEPAFGLLHVDEKKLRSDMLQCDAGSTYAEICQIVYRNSKSVFSKSEIILTGDKNPAYSLFLDGLFRIFPDIRFIHITRDHRDNILSMKQVDFESGFTTSLAERWKYYNNRINKFKNIHPENFLTLRYEDLVKDTEGSLRNICAFLEIGFLPAMLDFTGKKDAYYELYPHEALDKYHANLFKPISGVPVNRWKEKMKPLDIRIADQVAGASAEANGYERKYTKFNIWLWFFTLPGILYGRLYFCWGAFVDLLPWKIKMTLIHGMAAIFKPYWKRYPEITHQGKR